MLAMNESPPLPPHGGSPGACALASLLEEVSAVLARVSKGTRNAAMRERLGACPEALQGICSGLRGMADALDAGRTDLLARRRRELHALLSDIAQGMATLREADRRAAAEVGRRARELDAASTLPPTRDLAARLRDIAAALRDAAAELGGHLQSVAEKAKIAGRRAAAFETQAEPPLKPDSRDRQTGLHSPDAFAKRLRFAVATGPFRGPWSLLLAEVDRVAEMTERVGVSPCEMLVTRIARKVGARVRSRCPGAFVARHGETTFAAIVPGDPAAALDLAEHVRQGVASVSWSVTTRKGRTDLATTASIGLAPYRRGDTVAALTQRTQKALRRARSEGPDKVVSQEAER
jgi:diguanylate cyclase